MRRQVGLPIHSEERVDLSLGLELAGEGVHVDELGLHIGNNGNNNYNDRVQRLQISVLSWRDFVSVYRDFVRACRHPISQDRYSHGYSGSGVQEGGRAERYINE